MRNGHHASGTRSIVVGIMQCNFTSTTSANSNFARLAILKSASGRLSPQHVRQAVQHRLCLRPCSTDLATDCAALIFLHPETALIFLHPETSSCTALSGDIVDFAQARALNHPLPPKPVRHTPSKCYLSPLTSHTHRIKEQLTVQHC